MSTKQQRLRPGVRGAVRAAIGVLAGLAAGATIAAPASAGTYRVWTCKTPGNTPTSSAGWTESGFNAGPGQWESEDCAAGGGLHMFMNGGGWGGNTWKAWTWTAPADTTIANASVRYSMASNRHAAETTAGPGWWAFKDGTAYDSSHVLATCHSGFGCTASNDTFNVSGPATAFGVAAGCMGDAANSCPGGNRLESHIYYAAVDLNDNTDPTVTSSGGTVSESRTLAGVESLSWSATDKGGGIWQSEVKIGGTVVVPRSTVDGNGGRCANVAGNGEFGWPVPCKLSAGQSIGVDTTKVPDGTYTLTATVWDAANNTANIASRRVTIDNVPPPTIKTPPNTAPPHSNDPAIQGDARPGSLLTAVDGTWTDATAQISRQWQVADAADGPWSDIPAAVASTYRPSALQAGKYLRLLVTATSKEGAGTATSAARAVDTASGGSLALLSANNGSGGDPSTGKLVASKARTKVTVGFKKTVRIAGKLVDAANKPIAGGQIDVFETIAPGGARTKVASITSDSKGRYSWSPATRSNRLEELAYSRQKGSDNYQSTQSLQVFVRAGLRIKLKRKRIGSYGTGIITGRVIVDGFPASGVRVEAYAIGHGKPKSGGTVKTDSAGRFRWKYRYDRVDHGTVALFFKVHRDPDMPALDARSNIVRQRIG